jgi:glutathione synthase
MKAEPMAKPFSFLWVTDTWKSLDRQRDTTLRLAAEAAALGYASAWCDYRSISLQDHTVTAKIYPLDAQGEREEDAGRTGPIAGFSSINYRVDPPVSLGYLHPLHLIVLATQLSAGPPAEIVNPAEAITSLGEKLLCELLPQHSPFGIVSANEQALLAFGTRLQVAIAKPLHGAMSKDVHLLSWKTETEREASIEILRRMTDNFDRAVVLQEFLTEIYAGETRVWYLDGDPIAVAKKIPSSGSAIVDIDRGATIVSSTLNPQQQQSADAVGAILKSKRIRLAAVDMIGTKITDFNITSPGLLRQMEAVTGDNLARRIILKLAGDA